MMQSEILLPNTWQLMNASGFDFSSPFTSTEDSTEFPSSPDLSSIFSSENFSNAVLYDQLQDPTSSFDDFALEMEGIESFLSYESERSSPSEELWSPDESIKSSEEFRQAPLTGPPLALPEDGMEVDNLLAISHLLMAYGEAVENNQRELEEVVLRCLGEKANPTGAALERLAYSLSQDIQSPDHYLTRESTKNLDSAFKAFYQIFPYGRFAHFAANSAILESIPADAETICIIDFDIREGIQWPPVIEAAAKKQKELKLISINWGQGDFDDTKRRLCDYARHCGLNAQVEQMGMEELVGELKKLMKRGGTRMEWLVFNCMVGLPHLGRGKSRRLAKEFVTVAKGFLSSSRGILTLGNGDSSENLESGNKFGSFFETNVMHYQALLESLEANFPVELLQARMAMEALFVAPSVSMEAWKGKWEELSLGYVLQEGIKGLEGVRVSEERLVEGRGIAREGASLFGVRVGGWGGNEMVLDWRGSPMVRVSAWRSES